MVDPERYQGGREQLYEEAAAFREIVQGFGEDETRHELLRNFVATACERNINHGRLLRATSKEHHIDWSRGLGRNVELREATVVGRIIGYGIVTVFDAFADEFQPTLTTLSAVLFDIPAYYPRQALVSTPILDAKIQIL